MKPDGAFGAVTVSLTEHGEAMRRAEASILQTRKEIGCPYAACGRKEREHRPPRHLRVSLPVTLAGRVSERRLHWFCRVT